MKPETLLKRLEAYDEKYRAAILKPNRHLNFGYGMRAYHAIKRFNPPEWKIQDKANELKKKLDEMNIPYKTHYV